MSNIHHPVILGHFRRVINRDLADLSYHKFNTCILVQAQFIIPANVNRIVTFAANVWQELRALELKTLAINISIQIGDFKICIRRKYEPGFTLKKKKELELP